jgi:GAF domain-containing protein
MVPAPIPADEAKRLQALRDLSILGTPPEPRFDRIVQFAAGEFDMPIVLVGLIDEHRQWFKAKVGLDASEFAREVSFCGHAIVQSDLVIIEDATRDARFADNPLVTGPPHVRFYCGAPLPLPSGAAVGTLCLIDRQPRSFGPLDQAILIALRDLVLEALGARKAEA